MKKLNFNFDITGTTNIALQPDEQREIVYKIFGAARLFDHITLLERIKSGDAIPLINFTPAFSEGTCGFSNNNDIIVTDKTITTKALKSDVALCPSDLTKTAFERYLPDGVLNEMQDLTFKDALVAYMAGRYAREIQRLALVGDTAGTPADAIDGLVTQAYAAGSGVVSVSGTAPTSTDALTKLFNIYEAMKSDILDPEARPVILVGMDWLRKAAIQSYNDNRTAYNFTIDAQGGFVLPTTNVRVQGFNELNGTNKALAGAGIYAFVGTDLEDDMSQVKMWFSEDNQEIRSTFRARLGAALVFADQFVKYN